MAKTMTNSQFQEMMVELRGIRALLCGSADAPTVEAPCDHAEAEARERVEAVEAAAAKLPPVKAPSTPPVQSKKGRK
jgi:hypothetical protein